MAPPHFVVWSNKMPVTPPLTHFVVWINKIPGILSSPVLHQEVWNASDPDLNKKQSVFSAKATKLTGDGGFFFRQISAKAAKLVKRK